MSFGNQVFPFIHLRIHLCIHIHMMAGKLIGVSKHLHGTQKICKKQETKTEKYKDGTKNLTYFKAPIDDADQIAGYVKPPL